MDNKLFKFINQSKIRIIGLQKQWWVCTPLVFTAGCSPKFANQHQNFQEVPINNTITKLSQAPLQSRHNLGFLHLQIEAWMFL